LTSRDKPKAKTKRRPKQYKFVPLPPDFHPTFCTFDEACSYARCSRWTGNEKVKLNRWKTFKDGRIRKVIFASVVEDMDRTMAEGLAAEAEPTKRPVGRPVSAG
jgi:hypothetical protein